MKLNSFREILAKKTPDVSLKNLVRFMRDDTLVELVYESLEKMARAQHRGDSANNAIRHFGTEMDPGHEPDMIHDALSHHASHYNAALKTGNKDKADQHMKQIFRIVDMADQAQKHSHGKLKIDAVPVQPWERNTKLNTYTADDPKVGEGKYKVGEFKTKTKGWRHRGNDFSFLQEAPHESYEKETRRHGHNGAYPLEQMSVNGKHLDIAEVPQSQKFESHPFDHNPIMAHFEEPVGKRTPERDKQFLSEADQYSSSPHVEKYFANQESRRVANPEAYSNRGSKMSDPVHAQPAQAAPAQAAPAQAAPAQAAPAATKMSQEDFNRISSSLTPELAAKLKSLFEGSNG